jgi:hypothetical protein
MRKISITAYDSIKIQNIDIQLFQAEHNQYFQLHRATTPDPFVQALASTVLNIVSTSHPNTNKYDTQHKSIQQNHQTITSNSSRIPQTAIQPKHRNSTITDPLYPLHPWLTRTAHCRRVTRPRPQRVEINLLILTRFFRM